MRTLPSLCASLALCLPIVSFGCSSSDTSSSASGETDPCSVHLAPSADDQTTLQTALIEAQPGATICLGEGTFKLKTEVSIDVDGLTLEGAGQGQTILDFSEQDTGGNGIIIRGNQVTVAHFDVKNTPGDGIRADAVDDITFRHVSVLWDKAASLDNGAYGLYPVGSKGVMIDSCVVVGARDAGVYVGQSEDIIIKDSEAHGCVAGFEIENSTDAEMFGNHAHDNTGGILVFNLPGLPVQDGKRANVHDNLVENNNVKNFGDPGAIVSKVPAGIGIMILAADDNEIHGNEIRGNGSTAVLMVSYIEFLFGAANDDQYDHFPQGNWIHDNTIEGNGLAPDGLVKTAISAAPVADMVWDGCEDPAAVDDGHVTNCFSGVGSATYLDFNFCTDAADKSTDITPVTCTYEPLPSSN